jgi:GntR family transcriptional regulator
MRKASPSRRTALDEVVESAPDLSTGSAIPAHARIEQWLTGLIDAGTVTAGDRLPREDALAAALGVSRMTLRQALAALERHGTIVRKPGRQGGTFVAEPRIVCDLTGLAGFTEQMRRARVRAGARVVSVDTREPSPAAARALGLDSGERVHEVVRVRSANREPLALEHTSLPAALFPDLLDHRLTGSLYRLLATAYDHAPHTATEVLEPVIATSEQATLLHVTEGSPLMRIERTAYTASGVAVEFARDLFRADRTRITLRTGLVPAARASAVAEGAIRLTR